MANRSPYLGSAADRSLLPPSTPSKPRGKCRRNPLALALALALAATEPFERGRWAKDRPAATMTGRLNTGGLCLQVVVVVVHFEIDGSGHWVKPAVGSLALGRFLVVVP